MAGAWVTLHRILTLDSPSSMQIMMHCMSDDENSTIQEGRWLDAVHRIIPQPLDSASDLFISLHKGRDDSKQLPTCHALVTFEAGLSLCFPGPAGASATQAARQIQSSHFHHRCHYTAHRRHAVHRIRLREGRIQDHRWHCHSGMVLQSDGPSARDHYDARGKLLHEHVYEMDPDTTRSSTASRRCSCRMLPSGSKAAAFTR
jgi:hypothetical protein